MKKTIECILLSVLLPFLGTAQCVIINNLPDTIQVCKNSSIQLNPNLIIQGSNLTIDTTWSPAAGLSNANVMNPFVNIGVNSVSYKLSILALTPFNSVVNGDFSLGATGFTTVYVPGTGGTWGLLSLEGQYAISANANNVHTNFANFYDHTVGTAAGAMLLVNGSGSNNAQVWCQNINVVPNTDYDFSAWAASCTSGSPAVLQFSIDGVLLGTPLYLPSATGQWVNFHALWNSGIKTNIDICIVDQQTALSGNDFAIDDIEFRQLCTEEDSVYLNVTNLTPSFSYTIDYGCDADTVHFTAINLGGDDPVAYNWDFGNGTGDTAKNPSHVFTTQDLYNVKLTTQKNGCKDSITIQVDTRHPLIADFNVDDDSVCQGQVVTFTNTSTASTLLGIAPTYFWDFGDGSTSTQINPFHTFTKTGVFNVMMVVQDFVPCTDTAYYTIVVDSIPFISASVSQSDLCEGQAIQFDGNMLNIGLEKYYWQFGDGERIENENPVSHAYDTNGNFTVTLTAEYRICNDATQSISINVKPMPRIDLGPDTTYCPDNEWIIFTDHINSGNPLATWLWSDGSTTPNLKVFHEGEYWTRVSIEGCETTDSVQVFKDCYTDLPNAFTPNGDGANDYFYPRQLLSKGVVAFKMTIYNRWGEKIWETDKTDGRGWDGKFNGSEQPQGVYIYMMDVFFKNQTHETYRGNVTLLR